MIWIIIIGLILSFYVAGAYGITLIFADELQDHFFAPILKLTSRPGWTLFIYFPICIVAGIARRAITYLPIWIAIYFYIGLSSPDDVAMRYTMTLILAAGLIKSASYMWGYSYNNPYPLD